MIEIRKGFVIHAAFFTIEMLNHWHRSRELLNIGSDFRFRSDCLSGERNDQAKV